LKLNRIIVNLTTFLLQIAGDQDPYAPLLTQAELFTHLGRGEDRVWSIIANADHAVHLSEKRYKLVENVRNFLVGTMGSKN